jgi:hypothetical protein
MAKTTFTGNDWDAFKNRATVDPSSGRTKSANEIFADEMRPEFDPKNIKVRESFDSPEFPLSTPVAIGLDVTGSMGRIPHNLITDGLGRMVEDILNKKPVTDPQLMFMAIGDSKNDQAPLQATQFETDIRIAEQLKNLWLEGNGGGNYGESYHLAWYFLARKADIDSYKKRGVKGILLTVGDENIHQVLTKQEIERVFGDSVAADISSEELLQMVEQRFDVYHLMVKENGRDNTSDGGKRWNDLLGERVIPVTDYTKIPEIIVATLEVIAGKPKNEVVASWDGSTALAVKTAINGLSQPIRTGGLTQAGAKKVWRPGVK